MTVGGAAAPLRSTGPAAVLRRGLELTGVRARRLLLPGTLDLAATLARIAILALWLPLIHGVLAGDLRLGRRLAFLQGLMPEEIPDDRRLWFLAGLAGAILALTLVKGLARFAGARARGRLMAEAELKVGGQLLDEHLRFGQAYFDEILPKRTVTHLQRLPRKAARIVSWALRAFGTALELALYAALMVVLAPELAAGALTVLALYYAVFRRFVDRAEARLSEEDDLDEEAAEEVHDLVSNRLLVMLHRPRPATVAEYRARTGARGAVAVRRGELLELLDQGREALNVVLILAFVMAAAWAVAGPGPSSVSRYIVFFFVLRRSMSSFSTLQKLPRQLANLRENLATLEDVLAQGRATVVRSGPRPFTAQAPHLAVRGLRFTYPGGPEVLRGVDLQAAPGALHAVVGRNGSGKSTLVKLLLRLYDCPPGTLLLDGVDVRELDLESLRARTAFAGPEPMLFRGSIRANLLHGLERVPEERVARVVAATGLEPIAARLPRGLDEPVGAASLSRGEQQRVALARAVLRDAPVLLLDEATSSLDVAGELEAAALLEELARTRLVLVVTHRLATLPADTLVTVLDAGRVVQRGRRDELGSSPGPFRDLLADGPAPRPAAAIGGA